MTICGLIQSIFVRVPVTEIRFPISKIAEGEWCAETTVAKRERTILVAKEIGPFKLASSSGMRCSITWPAVVGFKREGTHDRADQFSILNSQFPSDKNWELRIEH